MLQRIGERIKGWIAGVIIALVAGAFVFWGIEFYFEQSGQSHQVAATVNGVKISNQQLQQDFSDFQRQQMSMNGGHSLSPQMQKQLKAYVLQNLVTNAALLTTLRQEGFVADLNEIKMMIASSPNFQVNGQFSREKFQSVLMQAGLSPEAYIQRVRSQWLMVQLNNAIVGGSFVMPSEVSALYAIVMQSRAFQYAVIPYKPFMKHIHVSDKAAASYYHQNQASFKTPMKVKVQYLLLSPQSFSKSVTVSNSELQDYYQAHQNNFTKPARFNITTYTVPIKKDSDQRSLMNIRKKAGKLSAMLNKGDSLADINKQLKLAVKPVDAKLSAIQIDKRLLQLLSQLKPGTFSSPIHTSGGYTVFKLVELIPQKTESLDVVKPKLIAQIKRQKLNVLLSKKSNELTNLTYTNPDSLTPAAKQLGLPVQTSDWISTKGEKTGLFSNAKILRTVFSDNVLKEGNNSNPVSLANGDQVVVRVAQKLKSQSIPLTKVQSKIKQMLTIKQARGQAGLMAYKLEGALRKGASKDKLALLFKVKWLSVPLMSMKNKSVKGVPNAVIRKAFSIPSSVPVKQGAVGTVRLSDGKYAVILLDKIQLGDMSKVAKSSQEALTLKLSKLWGRLMKDAFVSSVVADSKIKMNNN